MENLKNKAHFLRYEYTAILSQLDTEAPRKWGKMNVLQMIEHMSDYVRIASGKTELQIVTPEDKLPRMQGFLMSEKPFHENTSNVLMPDTPAPVKHNSKADAINELQQEIDHFFEVYDKETGKKTPNPFFGNLEFDMQVQLLHKHATHHLRQFAVEV